MKKTLKEFSLVLLALLFIGVAQVFAQDEELVAPIVPDFVFKYWKKADGFFELSVNMTAEGEDGYYPLEGLPVNFLHITDTSSELLGTLETDGEGNAVFRVDPASIIHKDTAGLFGLSAAFDGNEEYEGTSEEIYVKDVKLTMSLETIDSVNTVLVTATYIKGDGNEYPITDQEIFLYKQGLYSWLQIGEGWLVDGECEIVFPEMLPGDKDGNVALHLAITEHSDFGNVEVSADAPWGVIPKYFTEENGKLWTTLAPTWMVILLIILLSGVWGHYIYAMVQIRRIKKAAP